MRGEDQNGKNTVLDTESYIDFVHFFLEDTKDPLICSRKRKVQKTAQDINPSGSSQLKEENQMLWVGRMNEIQARAREIVQTELIFV